MPTDSRSGAGEIVPAAAQDASRPGSWRSSTSTDCPPRRSSNASDTPIIPPPTTTVSYLFFMLQSYQLFEWRDAELKRLDQFDREKIGLLRQVFRARPVRGANRILRLAQEAANLLGHVVLVRIELAPVRAMQILLRGRDVLLRLFRQLHLI